ncbi:MAG TPA: hypothetical protein VFT74_02210 [Isosphaeraceae bacterium]|nr:hypothetical protein [Isosphaeraceae bacterium]
MNYVIVAILETFSLHKRGGRVLSPALLKKQLSNKVHGIVVPSTRKKLKKSQNIFTWIRKRTSPFCFGVKTIAGNPAHCNKNKAIKLHFQALRAGYWSRRLSRLKNNDIADHFTGRRTYYFTADGRSSVPEVLINLDIDCHHSGSLAGAVAFAEHLRNARFPNLYFEASTNGKGIHGYVVVVKGDLGDEGLNSALMRLDRWLKHELSRGKWDVENVEVKGQAPVFNWGEGKYELRAYKSGQLAKLPREALTRADELRETTRIDVDALRRLKLPSEMGEPGDSVADNSTSRKGHVVLQDVEKKQTGSIAGRHFGPDELARLKGSYPSIARVLLGERKLVTTGRKVITVEDLAIFLMILRFFTKNMNVDGTLPTARWREMWSALYEAGDIERAWCHHRFAMMRNFLSEQNLLSWEDEGFVNGSEVHGRYVPGTAAKWRASEELMDRLDAEDGLLREEKRRESILYGCKDSETPSRDLMNFEFITDFALEDQVQEREEGGSILYGCKLPPKIFSPKATRQHHQTEPAFIALMRAEILPQRPQFRGYSWQQGLRMAA